MELSTPIDIQHQLLIRREKLEGALATSQADASLNRLLAEVDSALARIQAGSYGLCDTCHDPVEEVLLHRNPLVRHCLDHLRPEEKEELEQDLRLAWQIQNGLLPDRQLALGPWEVHYHYEPAGPVSGDYCDIIRGNEGAVYFLLGDVSGKGVAASMLVSQLHALFRSLLAAGIPFPQIAERANRLFCESTLSSSYATLVCGRAASDGTVDLCNAGHLPPLWIKADGASPIESTGLPLGMFCGGSFGLRRIQLEPGQSLLLYTDGLTEARNTDASEYGLERLRKWVAAADRVSARGLIEECLRGWRQFVAGEPIRDDLTVMALHFGL